MTHAKIVLDHPHAQLPAKGSPGAAGFDVHSVEVTVIPPGAQRKVDTGLRINCPEGTYLRVAPRSGLASKRQINVHAGVLDPDYTGRLGVFLYNHGDEPLSVGVGDRIAQVIFERYASPELVVVERLEATQRGDDGFGSTGGFA